MSDISTSSLIFPVSSKLPKVLGNPRSRREVMEQIQSDLEASLGFNLLHPQEQEALLGFCMGNRSLQITYDPFFRNIFQPLKHPERLNRFLSAVLGQSVTVHKLLPREGVRLSAEASLMIMDILVALSDGTLVNVEMQKIGYHFPIERTFCYGSDLLVRQYEQLRDVGKKPFSYTDIRPVYVIVLMEKSSSPFAEKSDSYIHHSLFQLDTGVPIANLLNFIYIPLDIFLKMPHNELTELEAWLYFLGSDNPLHIQRIIEKYPFFREIYQDIVDFRYHPKELITMFSEALIIADQNTVKLMIDELKDEIKELGTALSEKDAALSESLAEIARLKAELAAKE